MEYVDLGGSHPGVMYHVGPISPLYGCSVAPKGELKPIHTMMPRHVHSVPFQAAIAASGVLPGLINGVNGMLLPAGVRAHDLGHNCQ